MQRAGVAVGFEQQDNVAPAVTCFPPFDPAQFGRLNIQPGLFFHFANNGIHKGLVFLHMPTGKSDPAPVFADLVLHHHTPGTVIDHAHVGQFRFFVFAHKFAPWVVSDMVSIAICFSNSFINCSSVACSKGIDG